MTPLATANIGFAHLRGELLPLDTERGMALIKQGAAEGNGHAALWLAEGYLDGQSRR